MNREIEFRVWCKRQGRWLDKKPEIIYGLIYPNDKRKPEVMPFLTFAFTSELYEVYQYTGFKDKNGKKIFEGDIVKGSAQWLFGFDGEKQSVFKGDGLEYTHGEVAWVCAAWKVCQKYVGARYLSEFTCCDEHPADLEVIGNICENPELSAYNENKE